MSLLWCSLSFISFTPSHLAASQVVGLISLGISFRLYLITWGWAVSLGDTSASHLGCPLSRSFKEADSLREAWCGMLTLSRAALQSADPDTSKSGEFLWLATQLVMKPDILVSRRGMPGTVDTKVKDVTSSSKAVTEGGRCKLSIPAAS